MTDIYPTITNDVISVTVDSTENIVTVTSYDVPTVVIDFINHAGISVPVSFLELTDVEPSSYTGNADKLVSASPSQPELIFPDLTVTQVSGHIGSTSNPHSVTANQVLPSQTGNNRKHLQTDGTNASWGNNFDNVILDNVASPPTPSANTQLIYAKSDGIYAKNESGIELGLSSLTIVPRSTSFQLDLSDIDTLQNVTNTCDITIPSYAIVPIPIGSMIVVVADTIMTVKFVAGLGVTINKEVGLTLNAQYAVAGIVKTATDIWIAFGSLKV